MKTTGMSIKVTSHLGAQIKNHVNRLCKDTERTPGTRSRMRIKITTVVRADRRPEPGIQTQIETRYQMEMGGEVVARFTQMTMRMSLIQRALSHLILSPELHPLLLKEGCEQRGFLAVLSTRQVYPEMKFVWTDKSKFNGLTPDYICLNVQVMAV